MNFLKQNMPKLIGILNNSNLKFTRSISSFENINKKTKPFKKSQKQNQNQQDQRQAQQPSNLSRIESPNTINKPSQISKFEDEITHRRFQAKHSILFKIDNETDLNNLIDDCEFIGTKMLNIFYINEQNSSAKAALIEFESKRCIDTLLKNYGQHFLNTEHLPCITRLLLYKQNRNNQNRHNQNSTNKTIVKHCLTNAKEELSSTPIIDLKKKFSFLDKISNSDEQILKFYDYFKIDDLGYRIRYFIASIVEESFYSLFKNCVCLPFGSSANKFGHKASDLDLLFSLDNKFFLSSQDLNTHTNQRQSMNRLNGKLIFYSKYNKNEQERDLAKQFLELANFVLSNILPKFSVRQLIKGARVPILEFDFELPSKQKLNCDLSMSNLQVSYQMTKLFWTYTQMDNRVAPLIFLIKYWASISHVTNTFRPSPNITNFQLTVLILNFLLRLDNPIILPLESMITHMRTNADSDLKYTINENLNVNELKQVLKSASKITLKDLLMGFFNYYSNFDFDSNMISLSRKLDVKTNQFKSESLVILNPFMPELNASKNVNRQNLKKFSQLCNESYQIVQANLDKSTNDFDLVNIFSLISINAKKIKNAKYEVNILADEMNNVKRN